MFNGTNFNTQSIADFGANRILGIRGSIMGYINTGNPYDKYYYKKDIPLDKFDKKSSTKSKVSPWLIAGGILAAGAGVAALLKKKGKVNFKCLSNLRSKVKNLFNKDKVKLNNDKIKNVFNKDKIKNIFSKDKFKNLFSKLKFKSKKPAN